MKTFVFIHVDDTFATIIRAKTRRAATKRYRAALARTFGGKDAEGNRYTAGDVRSFVSGAMEGTSIYPVRTTTT